MDIKFKITSIFAVIGSVIANLLGGWDSALSALSLFMAIDWITGVLISLLWHRSPKSKSGCFSSRESLKGLIRKGMMLLVVFTAVQLDRAAGIDYLRTGVILFFIANEGLSILENTAIMGVPYPAFLRNALEALKRNSESMENENEP